MNAKQRGRLLQIVEDLRRYYDELESMTETEEKYDNLPESIQESEKGEAISECIDALRDGTSYLQDSIDTLEAML